MFPRAQLVVLALASALATAIPLVARDDPVCSRRYTVVAGDTCDTISVTQNVSTYQLATANAGLINAACDNLFVGESLCLGFVGHDCTTVDVVVAGDTCESIIAAAGITFSTLLANNPNINNGCTNIYVDEVLCTAATII